MHLVLLTGRSGSGKSTALHQLEDSGFYCVDNLPAGLLPDLVSQSTRDEYSAYQGLAVCIDVRNSRQDLERLTRALNDLESLSSCDVVYLDASDEVLTQRFSETRRRHPLSNNDISLHEAIQLEASLLEALRLRSNLIIDTSNLTIYELREAINTRLLDHTSGSLSLLIESFGFKRGVPTDADLVFDTRLLPNPHWSAELRTLTGKDQAVIDFLRDHKDCGDFIASITGFLTQWLPLYERSQRTYVTVAIGCTGGQHRSVFVAEEVFSVLKAAYEQTQIRHRELRAMMAE
jgi:UPF0042 nucleotide-binding protein